MFVGSARWQWLLAISARFLLGVFVVLFGLQAVLMSVRADVDSNNDGVGDSETTQTNPKSRSTNVAAKVKAQTAPPYPVLISPSNGAILTSGVVTFSWYAVTGHVATLDRYELYINGVQQYGNLSLGNQTTGNYVQTFDGSRYELKLKQDKWLADGSCTWKIRVVDVNDKGSDSSTWTFVVDSHPPPLLIISVDTKPQAISATDPSTFPTLPIEVSRSDPEIIGHTESYSTVQAVVTYPDGSTQKFQNTAIGDGRFFLTIRDLPADKAVLVTFTSIDLAGNSTVLSNVPILYKPARIIITLPLPLPQAITLDIRYRIPDFLAYSLQKLSLTPTPSPQPGASPTPAPLRTPPPKESPPSTRVIELPNLDPRPWLVGWFLLLFGYIVSLYALTGNSWGRFPGFVLWYFGALLRASPKGNQEMIRQGTSTSLGLIALVWEKVQSNRILRRHFWVHANGQWVHQADLPEGGSLVLHHRWLRWDAETSPDPTRALVREPEGRGTNSIHESGEYRRTWWITALEWPKATVLVLLPRFILILEIVVWCGLFWGWRASWLPVLLIPLLILLVRDWQWNLPSVLRALREEKRI